MSRVCLYPHQVQSRVNAETLKKIRAMALENKLTLSEMIRKILEEA